ncbi:response regulator [Parablautia sp. Marseille-Q6255]|uniref:response regulator n=1 Tax=Parablautia sp. Marseille-Q6255 TaxID=3039593 RepID=UPI0024BD1247|nr:response regulator [Parablautia sp. Marseille-Q6255]
MKFARNCGKNIEEEIQGLTVDGEETMSIQKVVIADDEERICRLIEALIDWETLGLEIAAVAHNGVEACEIVEQVKPDILITDIRMPGCSGLELVEQVKRSQPEIEIIIISGYAHFEYAQQAIKFGVGDYLLKPISKAELNSTLQKLSGRISRRKESEQDRKELLRRAQQDDEQLRQSLIFDLQDKEGLSLSGEILQERYHLRVQEGLFQVFLLHMDSGTQTMSEASAQIMMEKARGFLERGLRDKCLEFVLAVRGYQAVGVMNYRRQDQKEIRRALKNCLGTLETQKNLFQPVAFSASLGGEKTRCEDIRESFREAEELIWERLVRGTGRLLERQGTRKLPFWKNLLDTYLSDVTAAAEVLDPAPAEEGAKKLLMAVRSVPDVRGSEIINLVYAAADLFAARVQLSDRSAALEQFHAQCERRSSIEEVFDAFAAFQREHLRTLIDRHENETVRPVRKAKQYIQDHFSEQITLEEVSDAVGLSPAYFSTLFKKTQGEGFARYLIRVRMEQAKLLLRESNLPTSEVCRKVGYNDLKHFTHTFEKAAGVKPSTYRKLYG